MQSPEELFLSRFVNNPSAYALQQSNGSYIAYRQPITVDLFYKHLNTDITLGIYTTNPSNNTCRWVCWDVDSEQEKDLSILISWLQSNNIHSIREGHRPGRSGHLWAFFDQPIPSDKAYLLAVYGKFYAHLDAEFFPKQPQLKEDELGNLVRLPLGIHRKPAANRLLGIFKDAPDYLNNGKTLNPARRYMEWFNGQPMNDSRLALDFINTLPKLPNQKKIEKSPSNTIYGDFMDLFPSDWPIVQLPGGRLRARCPVCALEGHDSHYDNLSIDPVNQLMYCFYGNHQHDFIKIITTLRQMRSGALNCV